MSRAAAGKADDSEQNVPDDVPPLVPMREPLEEESNPSASAREGEAELTRSPVGWFVLVLLGFLPTVGGTNPVRFESDSILGMRIQSHWLPTTGQYLAYQRDTYTNVTGRDLQLEAGRTTSLFKTMTETLDLPVPTSRAASRRTI